MSQHLADFRHSIKPALSALIVFVLSGVGAMHAHAGGHETVASSDSAASTQAAGTHHGPVIVTDGWVRWLPSKLPAAAYMSIKNTGDTPLTLNGASSPDYRHVMLHRTVQNGATSRMEMADNLPLPPHQLVSISPGGFHFMLTDATRDISPGATVTVDLHFSDGSIQHILLPVSPPTRTP